MADKVILSKSILTAIADAIRNKEGSSTPIPATELADRINAMHLEGSGINFLVAKMEGDPYTIDEQHGTAISPYCFYSDTALQYARFRKVKTTADRCMMDCSNLESVCFDSLTTLGSYTFRNDTALAYLIFTGDTICALSSKNAFQGSSIELGTGYVYVKSSLVNSYKSATN